MKDTQKAMLHTLRTADLKSYVKAVGVASAVTLVGATATYIGGAMLPDRFNGGAWNIFSYVFGGIAYAGGMVGETAGAAGLAVTSMATATVATYRFTKYGVKQTLQKLAR